MEWFLRPASQEEKTRFEHWHFLVRTVFEAAENLQVKTVAKPSFFEEREKAESFNLENVLRFEHPRVLFEIYEKCMTEQIEAIEAARAKWASTPAQKKTIEKIRTRFSELPEAAQFKAPFKTFFHLLPSFRGSALGPIPLFVYHPLRVTDRTATLAIPTAFPEFFEAALEGFLAPFQHEFKLARASSEHFLRLEIQA